MKDSVGLRWTVALLVGGMSLGIVAVRSALGQSSGGEKAAAAQAQVATLFQEGLDAASANDWRKARERFGKAFELRKHWKIAANLGRAEVQLGLHREAAEHLDYFLANAGPEDVAPKDRQAVDALLKQAQSHVATVTVVLPVTGAEVLVDGKVVGTSPLPGRLFLLPGLRALEARREGYEPAQERLNLNAGSAQQVVLEMKTATTRAGAGQGRAPESGVNGSATGRNTLGKADHMEDRPSSFGIYPLVIGGLIGTGVATVAGAAFVVVSNAYADKQHTQAETIRSAGRNCDVESAECKELFHVIDMKDAFANASLWSFIGAGALGLGTAIVAFTMPKDEQRASVKVLPVIASQGGGLVLSGDW